MLPKYHIFIGAVTSIIFYYAFNIPVFYSLVFFFSSFLIDIDHYLLYAYKTKNLSLKKSYEWYKKRKEKWEALTLKQKNSSKIMHFFFHGIEFLLIFFVLSFSFRIFFYVFLGFLLHLTLDYLEIIYENDPLFIKFSQIYIFFSNARKKSKKL